MENRIGITSWSLPSPNTYTLALAAELGFDAIQLDLGNYDTCMTYAHPRFQRLVTEESRRLGLQIVPLTLNALGGHGFVDGLDSADGRIACEILETGLAAAAAMGLEGVAVPSFGRNEIHTAAHLDATAAGLRFACRRAEALGLTVYTENVLSVKELDGLFDRVGSDRLRLLFDSQNYAAFGHDYAMEVLRAYRPLLGSYVHIKDGTTGMGAMPLGTGWSPLAEMTAFLKETDFRGAVILENNYDAPPFNRPEEGDVFDAISRDISVIRAMMTR